MLVGGRSSIAESVRCVRVRGRKSAGYDRRMSVEGLGSEPLLAFHRAIATGAVSPGECGFFFDFDGTLARVQDDPEAVYPVPGVEACLAALCRAYGRVAIISARPVGFLRSRFREVAGLQFFGLYGLEADAGTGEVRTHPTAEPFLPAMAEIARRARTELPPGAVEDKGLTVALHYRRHPELAGTLLAWGQAQTARHGLRLQHGRMVYELKPPGERNKGTVLREETGGLKGVMYFGDDLGDIAAFEAMAQLAQDRPDFLGVRVVVLNEETGGPVAAHADVRVQRPEGMPEFLRRVLSLTPP